ncbi:MAG: hypothetical protein RMM53_11170, partial [Bacteroidia bacterium]|nr:hypothetical protein [Bacteroidia bacterium]
MIAVPLSLGQTPPIRPAKLVSVRYDSGVEIDFPPPKPIILRRRELKNWEKFFDLHPNTHYVLLLPYFHYESYKLTVHALVEDLVVFESFVLNPDCFLRDRPWISITKTELFPPGGSPGFWPIPTYSVDLSMPPIDFQGDGLQWLSNKAETCLFPKTYGAFVYYTPLPGEPWDTRLSPPLSNKVRYKEIRTPWANKPIRCCSNDVPKVEVGQTHVNQFYTLYSSENFFPGLKTECCAPHVEFFFGNSSHRSTENYASNCPSYVQFLFKPVRDFANGIPLPSDPWQTQFSFEYEIFSGSWTSQNINPTDGNPELLGFLYPDDFMNPDYWQSSQMLRYFGCCCSECERAFSKWFSVSFEVNLWDSNDVSVASTVFPFNVFDFAFGHEIVVYKNTYVISTLIGRRRGDF